MQIENEIKLDYKDVLIRPKRSVLGSRVEVDLNRSYSWRNYNGTNPFASFATKKRLEEEAINPSYELCEEDEIYPDSELSNTPDWSGIPIMAANMDGVGTFVMADTLSRQGMFTCLVKTYSVNDLVNYFDNRYIRRVAITAKSEKGTACCYAVIVLLFLRLAHAVVRRHD